MTANPAPAAPPAERYARSAASHAEAKRYMPGGVNSPVRAYRAVGREPVTIRSGAGAWVTDVDGNRYVDYVGSYGPLILGHAAPQVLAAVGEAMRNGTTFGMPTEAETRLARTVVDAVPGVDVVRFVNSGTEAAMSALRLARAATGGHRVIKCIGCYHGHTDAMLVSAGSAATSLGVPSSPGVPAAVAASTLLVPFNDLDAVERAMATHRGEIACMAVEPIAGNMGLVPPAPGYLQGLRALCDRFGVPLLFDEVMTGFRVDHGCAQGLYGVTPDLTCLGKVVGGGLPCAAYGGREELMRQVAPDGPVYQAGTLSGNPLAMAAGQAQLDALAADGFAAYRRLEAASARLEEGLRGLAADAGCPLTTTRVGSMLGVFFVEEDGSPVRDYADATAQSTRRYAAFFGAMLDAGVILAPAAFECWFVSTAHDDEAIEHTLAAAGPAFAAAAATPFRSAEVRSPEADA
ncbi:glutamate-1-semialdehyde 2,1-aminomutase [Phycisphaera mikurensis]|uniref:Glutamate-1-semialdehyde 2,1-aminomutase n=1 Tax=Phycisphaera mikurensis (strain NBRC 102666 / KCTC 22515 / FYK2301M01) TaxID=1142394 RepID=I0IBW2_PHYMF|nr:glutamate-1-semialdehyde 2,1-aminomutase [Phycisphaera mikurensis]MBB6442024.1 glutamate-1-semialdehyde 2,1-aminomutase [Phycisphaera mikurensis]BAM02750.1 glutamate-1-semialdehyde 2,1-aminomutase [Phycisphaera mikurensis NBRC 102666]